MKHHYETQGQAEPAKQGSFHVGFPEPEAERCVIAKTIESELHKFENRNGLAVSIDDRKSSHETLANGDLWMLLREFLQCLHNWDIYFTGELAIQMSKGVLSCVRSLAMQM